MGERKKTEKEEEREKKRERREREKKRERAVLVHSVRRCLCDFKGRGGTGRPRRRLACTPTSSSANQKNTGTMKTSTSLGGKSKQTNKQVLATMTQKPDAESFPFLPFPKIKTKQNKTKSCQSNDLCDSSVVSYCRTCELSFFDYL